MNTWHFTLKHSWLYALHQFSPCGLLIVTSIYILYMYIPTCTWQCIPLAQAVHALAALSAAVFLFGVPNLAALTYRTYSTPTPIALQLIAEVDGIACTVHSVQYYWYTPLSSYGKSHVHGWYCWFTERFQPMRLFSISEWQFCLLSKERCFCTGSGAG